MNKVAKLFSADDVLLDLGVKSRRELFEAVGQFWEKHHVVDARQVVHSLFEREQFGSTGLGRGVAIPHARMSGPSQPKAIFVRTRDPLEFDAPDGVPVSLFLVLLVPSEATEVHLQILAEIAELLADNAFREQLQSCDSPEHIHELFANSKTD